MAVTESNLDPKVRKMAIRSSPDFGRRMSQNQKAVSAYFTSERILPFGFAQQTSRFY